LAFDIATWLAIETALKNSRMKRRQACLKSEILCQRAASITPLKTESSIKAIQLAGKSYDTSNMDDRRQTDLMSRIIFAARQSKQFRQPVNSHTVLRRLLQRRFSAR
jgi:hypothetical protein